MQIALLFALLLGLSSPMFSQESRSNARPDLTLALKVHEPDKPKGFTLVVTPGGFTRYGSVIDSGVYEIRIINRSGDKRLEVQLDRVSDAKAAGQIAPETRKLTAEAVDVRRGRLRAVQKLEPGTYKLWAVNFPTWTYTLTVK